jgi:hypothetical protein
VREKCALHKYQILLMYYSHTACELGTEDEDLALLVLHGLRYGG